MKTIKIVTNVEPEIQEVNVKKLFEYMGFKFAYVIKPFRRPNSSIITESPAIVEVSTGMQADSIVTSLGVRNTMKSRIEYFKTFLHTKVKNEIEFKKVVDTYNKLNYDKLETSY